MPKFGKILLAIFIFGSFIGYGLLLRFLIRDPLEQRRALVSLVRRQTSLTALILGIRVVTKNSERLIPGQNYLIVGNHLSYLDAIVAPALGPVCFVTSVEMRNTFFLGLLTELAGCLFVERRSKDRIGEEIKEITAALKNGFNVAIFPEATSTDGSGIKTFKRPLFQAALDANKAVLPITINYKLADGQAVTTQNRDNLFWYGDMDFGSHFLRFLGIKHTVIEVIVHPPIIPSQNLSRDELVELSYKTVLSAFQPII